MHYIIQGVARTFQGQIMNIFSGTSISQTNVWFTFQSKVLKDGGDTRQV